MLAAADAGLIKAGRRGGIFAGACKAPQAVYKRLGRLGRVSGKSPNWMPHCWRSALLRCAIPGYSSLVINGGGQNDPRGFNCAAPFRGRLVLVCQVAGKGQPLTYHPSPISGTVSAGTTPLSPPPGARLQLCCPLLGTVSTGRNRSRISGNKCFNCAAPFRGRLHPQMPRMPKVGLPTAPERTARNGRQ